MGTPEEVGEDFADYLEIDNDTGCWVWFGPTTKDGYPVYARRAAWRFAYTTTVGPIRKHGNFPVIEACLGRDCVNPDHRIGIPRDQQGRVHRCPVCQQVCGVPPEIAEETAPRKYTLEQIRDGQK